MEFRDYLNLARRNIWWLIALPLLAGLGAFLLSRQQTKQYVTTAQVLLRPNDPNERLGTSSSTTGDINSAASADRYVKAQANIAKGPAVRASAAKSLDGVTEQTLASSLSVTAALDSNILRISARSAFPEQAAAMANAASKAYIENRRATSVAGLERAIADLDDNLATLSADIVKLSKNASSPTNDAELETARSQFQTLSDKRQGLAIDVNLKQGESELIAEAAVPSVPVSPTPTKTAAFAAFAALLLAFGAIVARDRLDVRLRSREEAESMTGLTTLAELPLDRDLGRRLHEVSAIDDNRGLIAEAVRSLRVSLRFLSLEQPVRSILITSAVPGDGKSTLAINLAASYAEAGHRTLLVSADLRRPQVEKLAKMDNQAGLVETLSALAVQVERNSKVIPERRGTRQRKSDKPPVDPAVAPSLQPLDIFDMADFDRRSGGVGVAAVQLIGLTQHEVDNLWILPAGQPVASPVEILGSPVMKDFFALAFESFDMVIVDSPPVVPVSDSLVLSQFVDGVVFVASVRKTPRQLLERGVQLMSASSARVLGLVINRTPLDGGGYYGGYYGYSDHSKDAPSKKAVG